MKKFVVFIFLFPLILSCKKGVSETNTFKDSAKLNHQKVFEDEDLIFRNGEMIYFSIDSSLVMVSYKSDSLLLKVNLNNKEVSHFIPVGNGPEEFVNIILTQKLSDSTLMFMDANSSQLFQLNIITGEVIKDLKYDNGRCLTMVKNDNCYFSTGIFEEGMFGIWKDNEFVRHVFDYPDDKIDNKNNASKGLAYQGKLLVNDNLDRLFFCSSLFSYFELFEVNCENIEIKSLKKSYIGEYEYVPSQDENLVFAHPVKGNRQGYIDAVSTNELIYLLYSGRSIEDVGINNQEETRLANQILVYDWDGNPIIKYETDVDLKNICINNDSNIIYGVAHTPDPEIVYFEI